MVAVHSTARGPALGGCRMWTYDDARAAVRDVLRLSRAMTFKAAVAGLPLGGGKGVIMLRPDEPALTPERREAVLQDFGDTVEALGGDYLTAEDVGTSEPDMEVDRRAAPQHVTGLATRLRRPEPVDRARLRGRACASTLRARVRHRRPQRPPDRRDRPRQRRRPAGRAAARGRRASSSSPTSTSRKRELAERLGAEWTDPLSALTADVDVVAPCALGGVLNDDTVPALRCKAIAGAANNQLADDSLDARARRARHPLGARLRLQRRRDHQHLRRARARGLRRRAAPTTRVRAVGDTLRTIFDSAAALGHDAAAAAALELGRERLTQAASRPSSRSFSRCARSVIAANGRTVGGRVVPGGVEQLVLGPRARLERGQQLALALGAVGEVLVELGRRVGRPASPWPGQIRSSVERAQAPQPVEVLAQPPG